MENSGFQIAEMKITTLIENNSSNEKLKSEHGLSLYIETDEHKILFDTGKTDLFIHNAKELNINLQEVDIVVISHGHYDHIGGLIHFLKSNEKAKVFLKKEIFDYQYFAIRNKQKKNISYSTDLFDYKDRFVFLESAFNSIDNLYFIATIDKIYPLPKGNKILYKQYESKLIKDDFQHELVFAINSTNGLIVFCGCAHNGILNTISTVQRFLINKKIKTVIGGFHLIDSNEFVETETDKEIEFIAKELNQISNGVDYYTGHCTGNNAFNVLFSELGTDLQRLEMGNEILLNT